MTENTLNIIAYSIYLPITFFITIKVGWICYRNGAVYLRSIMPQSTDWLTTINKLLLIGYYLVNLGYASIVLSNWTTIHTLPELISSLTTKIGFITITLGIMHGFNLWAAKFIPKLFQTDHN